MKKSLIILLCIFNLIGCQSGKKSPITNENLGITYTGYTWKFAKCSQVYSIRCEWNRPVLNICKVALNCPGCDVATLCMGNMLFRGGGYLDMYIQKLDNNSKTYKTILKAETQGNDKLFKIPKNLSADDLRLSIQSAKNIEEDFTLKVEYVR